MAQKPYDDETEYQFNEGEEGEVIYDQEKGEEPVYEGVEAKPSKPSKRRIISLIAMGIVVIFVVYKVSSLLFTSKTKIPSVRPVKVAQIKKAPAVIPAAVVAPRKEEIPGISKQEALSEVPALSVSEKMPVVEEIPVKTDADQEEGKMEPKVASELKTAINEQISQLEESSKQLVAELQDQKTMTQDRLISIEQRVDSLKTSIGELQGVMQNLSSQLKKMEAAAKMRAIRQVRAKKTLNKKIRAKKRYFVEAVIPGRAWLKGVDGSAFTITIGDTIKGYGKVVSINSYSGTVTTSSGAKIYYGVNN